MATESVDRSDVLPEWVLAFGPFLVIGVIIAVAAGVISLVEFESFAVTGMWEILAVMTVIGFIAGILPVFVGMLWFPYISRLAEEWIHAVLAFSAGVLAFIAVEMAGGAAGYAGEAAETMQVGVVAAVVAVVTVVAMEITSRWRKAKTTEAYGDGLIVAYLVAVGLGLHSVGEGLAIGAAFAGDDMALVLLFTLGFIIHNVTEGPAVIAAVAREQTTPPLRHFAALGILAGGGVIIGGWIGSFATDPLVGAVFFAIAFGAIVQVLWEMLGLVRRDAEKLLSRKILVAFIVGAAVIFFLEDVVVEGFLGL